MPKNILANRKTAFYLTHWVLVCVQAIIALLLLLQTPSEENSAIFLGYSLEKLLLLSVPFGIFVLSIGQLIFYRSPSQLFRIDEILSQRLKPAIKKSVITVCIVFILIGTYFIFAINWQSFFVVAPPVEAIEMPVHTYQVGKLFSSIYPYLLQLRPIIILAIGLCIQAVFFLNQIQVAFRDFKNQMRSRGIYKILWVFGLFLSLWGVLVWGSTRLEPDFAGNSWQHAGAPILDSNMLLTFVFGIALIGIGAAGKAYGFGSKIIKTIRNSLPDRNLDILIGLAIWLVAAVVWISLPTEANWYLTEPRYPNFEYYPSSDALKYDIVGQNMLLGADLLFSGYVMHKPLYSAFLALLHTFSGPEYERISLIQTIIFAIFPALVYMLTKRLHSRLAGILASSLIILREANSIMLSSDLSVSHAKLLMTETPAIIGILLISWMVFDWIEKPNQKIYRIIFIGGGIGLLIQIRNELFFLLPVILLFNALVFFRSPKFFLKTSSLFVVGVLLFIIPWQIRISHFTGSPLWISRRANFVLTRLETNSDALPNWPQENLDSNLDNKQGVLQYFPSHFVHNQIQAFLIFPNAHRLVDSLIGLSLNGNANRFWNNCCSRENYIDRLWEIWDWQKWDGNVQKESLAAIVITLFFISVGIGKSSDKLGMRAIFLLIIVFSYYVILSIFRMSGGRRVQVVDWIWIIYFSIGLGQITLWAFRWLFSVEVPVWFTGQQKGRGGELPSNQKLISPENPSLRWKSIFSFCFLVLFCGALVPLIEQIIPPQYTEETLQTRIETIIMLDDSEIIREFLDNGGAVQQGKALYPRYYPAGEYGENQATDANLRQIGYLSTFLAGSNSPEIILPLTDIQQLGLPNYSDVLVVGCEEEYFDTLAIFSESQNLIIFRDPLPENLACPLENK